jgi:hypothetical protein
MAFRKCRMALWKNTLASASAASDSKTDALRL